MVLSACFELMNLTLLIQEVQLVKSVGLRRLTTNNFGVFYFWTRSLTYIFVMLMWFVQMFKLLGGILAEVCCEFGRKHVQKSRTSRPKLWGFNKSIDPIDICGCKKNNFLVIQGWLSDPLKWLSDLQLGDQKVTLNHLVQRKKNVEKKGVSNISNSFQFCWGPNWAKWRCWCKV